MILKLTGAASALFAFVMLTGVGIGADEPKKKEGGNRPDAFGSIVSVSEKGDVITITKKAKKGEEGVKKEYKLILEGDGKTEIEVTTEDKKLKPGLIAAIWLKAGTEDTVAKLKAFEKKKKAEKTTN